MTDKLKPCPFCGGEVTMAYTGSSDWDVACNTCPVETKFWVSAKKHGYGEGEHAEAVRRWNQRTAVPEVERGWTACSERRPDHYNEVLVSIQMTNTQHVAWWCEEDKRWYDPHHEDVWYSEKGVTHWMPLQPSPQGGLEK